MQNVARLERATPVLGERVKTGTCFLPLTFPPPFCSVFPRVIGSTTLPVQVATSIGYFASPLPVPVCPYFALSFPGLQNSLAS